jgi:hypothetical protein
LVRERFVSFATQRPSVSSSPPLLYYPAEQQQGIPVGSEADCWESVNRVSEIRLAETEPTADDTAEVIARARLDPAPALPATDGEDSTYRRRPERGTGPGQR